MVDAYIKPELLILIPLLLWLGGILKKTPLVRDWLIPYILFSAGVVMAASYVLLTEGVSFMSLWIGVMQGWAISAVEMQGFAMLKQYHKK